MPELKMSTKTYHEVDYGDLDKFIQSVYGRPEYEFVADIECGNDSSHTYTVKKEVREFAWDIKKFDEWKATGRGQWMIHLILADLCNRDLIPEGNYVIEVCW